MVISEEERARSEIVRDLMTRKPVIGVRPPAGYDNELGCSLCPEKNVAAIIELGTMIAHGSTATGTRVCGVCLRQLRREITKSLPWAR